MTVRSNPGELPTPGEQPGSHPGPAPHEAPTAPLGVAPTPPDIAAVPPGTPPTPSVQPAMVATSGDNCPSCGAHMAADQRYCLDCGHRRGDPRLPFMDAVVFMDAVKSTPQSAAPPPPPRESKPRMSANASLIAGVATLILAIGVGVLIGRSGGSGSSTAAVPPQQVIKVENGGGTGTSEATTSGAKEAKGGSKAAGKGKQAAVTPEAEKAGEEAQDEVLKTNPNVHLAPPTQEIGGGCEKGTAGCSDNGKFEGEFFGE